MLDKSDLRSRKCSNNNNIEEQATSDPQPNTQHNQNLDNTQLTNMSSSKSHHRRTQSESSAEEYGTSQTNGNGMWRNELVMNTESEASQSSTGLENVREESHTNRKINDFVDIILRVSIVLIFAKLETTTAFKREIHAEELWLYQNPRRPDIVKAGDLLFWVIVAPWVLTTAFYVFTRDRRDFRAASWAWTLALCLNAIPTSLLKITVGRPRPDYYYRCFPDGVMVLNEPAPGSYVNSSILDFNCTGQPSEINEGRKSFPSGHSSFAFASFGFITFYLGAKLQAFNERGRGHTWRQAVAVIPLIIAGLVAVSRTCDYHHHWQDVTVGGLMGLISGYLSYRQYFHSIFGTEAGKPINRWPNKRRQTECEAAAADILRKPLLGVKDKTKWYN